MTESALPTLILGAGPAGLTAGYLLAKRGLPVTVFEAEDQVGGIAKTVVRDGYRFDLGGHRFFTKAPEVDALWREVMGDEFLLRPRQSRIYWRRRFLDYPLSAPDVVRKLGPVELSRCLGSYAAAKLRPRGEETSLEQWVVNRFGRRLFENFFKTYNEKLWGVPVSEIRAEFAAQRIKDLSFSSAVRSAVVGNRDNRIKSLIGEFHYPRLGPGQMWERMADSLGDQVLLETRVESIAIEGSRVVSITAGGRDHAVAEGRDAIAYPSSAATAGAVPSGGEERSLANGDTLTACAPGGVISSLPLRTVAGMADAPAPVLAAARGLRYRDFLTVALVLDGPDPFPDTWIYVHEPGVRVGRIQNFRAWSPWMVPDPARACVGMEFFCFEGDDLWSLDDDSLVDLAARELEQLGLARRGTVERGFVTRVPKAYPMYDRDYAERVEVIRDWLDGVENLQQVGRNGLHRYNNSDHSMLTAMRAVENLVDGAAHDIWAVNADSAYHEEAEAQDAQQPYIDAPETPAQAEPLSP